MNDSAIIIRPETQNDYKEIFLIHEQAFCQQNEAVLINNLRKTDIFDSNLSLIAYCNDKAVGHILFYPLTIKTATTTIPTLGLVPLAVKPEYQRKGIGTQLVNEGLKRAKSSGYKSVIVVGNPNFYGRFGFKQANNLNNNIGVPVKHLMSLELEQGSLKNVKGVVEYPAEFKDL